MLVSQGRCCQKLLRLLQKTTRSLSTLQELASAGLSGPEDGENVPHDSLIPA